MAHVAYLQIDCARGLLRACTGKMTPLIFAPHNGWKRNASPLVQCGLLACALILPSVRWHCPIIAPDQSTIGGTYDTGNCDNRLQICDGFIDRCGGCAAPQRASNPLAHPASCIAIIIF